MHNFLLQERDFTLREVPNDPSSPSASTDKDKNTKKAQTASGITWIFGLRDYENAARRVPYQRVRTAEKQTMKNEKTHTKTQKDEEEQTMKSMKSMKNLKKAKTEIHHKQRREHIENGSRISKSRSESRVCLPENPGKRAGVLRDKKRRGLYDKIQQSPGSSNGRME